MGYPGNKRFSEYRYKDLWVQNWEIHIVLMPWFGPISVPWDATRHIGDYTYFELNSYYKYREDCKCLRKFIEEGHSHAGYIIKFAKMHRVEGAAERKHSVESWYLYGIELTEIYEDNL